MHYFSKSVSTVKITCRARPAVALPLPVRARALVVVAVEVEATEMCPVATVWRRYGGRVNLRYMYAACLLRLCVAVPFLRCMADLLT